MFALIHTLGFRFALRIRDLSYTKLYQAGHPLRNRQRSRHQPHFRNGRHYTAFGVSILNKEHNRIFYYNFIVFGKQGHFTKRG